jgi:hypothetical protein
MSVDSKVNVFNNILSMGSSYNVSTTLLNIAFIAHPFGSTEAYNRLHIVWS